jgi:hypothetical protein
MESASQTITPTITESGGEDSGRVTFSQSRKAGLNGRMDGNEEGSRNWTAEAVQDSPVEGLEFIGSVSWTKGADGVQETSEPRDGN